MQGISNGFQIGFGSTDLQSATKNLQSAVAHPKVVDDYLQQELLLRRISGPFPNSLCTDVHVSRFGIIPKHHQQNKWCLIVDLSHPKGLSVNDRIPLHLYSLSYVTIDDAVLKNFQLEQGTMLPKIDIKSAFRLLLVHPADQHLLAMKWNGYTYIDHCIPFGLQSAPKLFNALANLLLWIA